MDKRLKVLLIVVILLLVCLAFYLISYAITRSTGYTITGKAIYSKQERVLIVKCMNTEGVELYCSTSSSNCLRQKEELGDEFNQINYVECAENPEECGDLNLPAWKIDNRFYFGIQDLGKLSEMSGCKVR